MTQVGIDQKVLDDAALIFLVRQTQDQFSIHGKATSSKQAVIGGESNMISRKVWQRIQVGLSGAGFLCISLAFTANAQVKTETNVEEGLGPAEANPSSLWVENSSRWPTLPEACRPR